MTLRVYLETNDGEIVHIDYGLAGEDYKAILRTELREEESKLKSYSGSRFVGVLGFDKEIKDKPKTYSFYQFNRKDRINFYTVNVKCDNCNETDRVDIPKGEKVNLCLISNMTCQRCNIPNQLHLAIWDGKTYVPKNNKRRKK